MLSTPLLIWLLFVSFLIHDGEELLTAASWLRRSRGQQVERVLGASIDARRSVTVQYAVAILVVGAVVLAACWAGAATYASTGRLHGLFVGVLAVMGLDGVKHIGVTLLFRGYTPGVVSAMLVELPYALYAMQHLLGAGILTMRQILQYGVVAVVLVFPLLWLGFALGRRLAPVQRA